MNYLVLQVTVLVSTVIICTDQQSLKLQTNVLCGNETCQPGEKCEHFASCLSLDCPPPPPPRCEPSTEQCGDIQCNSETEECILKWNRLTRKIFGLCRPIVKDPCTHTMCPRGTECIVVQKILSRGFAGICKPVYIDPCSQKLCSANDICGIITTKYNIQIGVCVVDPCLNNPCPSQFDCYPNKENPLLANCVAPISPCAYTTIVCPSGTSCGRNPNNPRVAICL